MRVDGMKAHIERQSCVFLVMKVSEKMMNELQINSDNDVSISV